MSNYKLQSYQSPSPNSRGTQDSVRFPEGTVSSKRVSLKLGTSLIVATASAALSWTLYIPALYLVALFVGLGIFVWTARDPERANKTLLPYAALEGYIIAGFTRSVLDFYDVGYGVVLATVLLVTSIFAANYVLYTLGFIQPNNTFMNAVKVLTGAALVFYLAAIFTGLFGETTLIDFYTGVGVWSIVLSLVMVGVAVSNITLDFMVLRQQEGRAPASHESFLAMLLLASLVWTYLEILRFISKLLASRR